MLILVLGLAGLLFRVHADLNQAESLMATGAGAERLRAMGQQMDTLRDRLHGLMAESVEMRLRTLDRSIASGKVSAEDLLLFQALQNDLRSLETYASTTGGSGLDSERSEHPRYRAAGGMTTASVTRSEMLNELSRLRTLLYLCLTGLVAGGGLLARRYWVTHHGHSTLTRSPSDKPHLLARRRQ